MMNELLKDLVVVFLLSVVVVLLLRRIRVPAIAGFVLAGVLVGPNALRVITDIHEVEVLAEIGVALLLFGIGLELSLDRMRRLWRLIIFGGAFQVGVTVLIAVLLGRFFGLGARPSVFVGCVVAVSSTAIVLSGLRARGELEAPHGRLTIGILVFQDLCVVPMILLIPLLAEGAGTGAGVLVALARAGGLLAGVLVTAHFLVPRVLHVVARSRQRDLFVLTVFLICIGTAWMASLAGVSVALGAFLGGLVVAGSDYRHQALSDLIPFREVFASLFFVSIGMLLDPIDVAENVVSVVALLLAIVGGKFVIVLFTGLILRLSLRVSIMAGAALAQVGEFSFVLMSAAEGHRIVEATLLSNLYVAIILSMLITPMFIALGPRLAAGVGRMSVLTRRLRIRTAEEACDTGATLSDHVIIAGFGLTGQELSRSLGNCRVPYVIVDMNSENVRMALAQGEPVFFGDVTSREVLEGLGLPEARELVLVINDPSGTERALHTARQLAPDVPVFVRVQYAADVGRLLKAGASDVIVSELEASAAVTARVLGRHQVRPSVVDPQLERIRARGVEENL